ncbi:MAG: hypothetical protein IIX65_08140 [Lachnospiraceae bacterium]|jgi:hypothetical protein|nr:hypothetical protein [Lachnospiraceae bacterium]
MGRRLIIDENSVYEIDEMCMRRKAENSHGDRQTEKNDGDGRDGREENETGSPVG